MQGERPLTIEPMANITWLMLQANAKFYTQLAMPGQVGEESSGDQVKCVHVMLKELYPDDDIPEDLIGFLDDKVSFFFQKKWSQSDFYTFISSDLELGPKRKERERGILIWKVAKKRFSIYF